MSKLALIPKMILVFTLLAFALSLGAAHSARGITEGAGRGASDRISVSLNNKSVPRYGVIELNIAHSDAEFSNVWEGPTITVTFTSPTNKTYTVGGFYHSRDLWKARFAPSEIGTWRWSLEWRDARGAQNASGVFECLLSAEKGFVRRHPTNPFRLIFEDGSLYPAIGIGECIVDVNNSGSPIDDDWGFDGDFRRPGEELGSRTDIDTHLSAYSKAGFNLFRWSVDNCAFKLWEKIDPGGNIYLEREGKFGDTLVSKLRQYGFRVYMVLFKWPPFPTDTGDSAKMNAVKRYVKYVVDRYGAYVDFWELMNEFPNQFNPINDDWYTIVANYIRTIDPYKHLISTSWERPDLPAIDINSPHWYQGESELQSDLVTAKRIRCEKHFAKPIIFGEQGNRAQNWDERSALRMRIRSWTAFFEEGMLIFWNTSFAKDYRAGAANIYLGPEERRYVRALQDFTAVADQDVKPIALAPSNSSIRAYGLKSARMILGYFHHFTSHKEAVRSTLVLDVPAAAMVTWIDPATGSELQTLSIGSGRQILNMPAFVVDLALRVRW